MSAKTINGLHFAGTVHTTTVEKKSEQLTDEFVVLDRFENCTSDFTGRQVMYYLVMAKSTGLTHIILATELTGCTCTSLHKKQDDRDN